MRVAGLRDASAPGSLAAGILAWYNAAVTHQLADALKARYVAQLARNASTSTGTAALFGFVGLPAKTRSNLGARLQDECVAQLARLFGPEASHPLSTMLRDWATEPYTATKADLLPADGHPSAADLQTFGGAWTNRMQLAGSEVANEHAGYLEGALEAAEAAISNLLHQPLATNECRA